MNLFLYYRLITLQQAELLFTPVGVYTGKVEEEIFGDMAKLNPMLNRLKKEFNLEM